MPRMIMEHRLSPEALTPEGGSLRLPEGASVVSAIEVRSSVILLILVPVPKSSELESRVYGTTPPEKFKTVRYRAIASRVEIEDGVQLGRIVGSINLMDGLTLLHVFIDDPEERWGSRWPGMKAREEEASPAEKLRKISEDEEIKVPSGYVTTDELHLLGEPKDAIRERLERLLLEEAEKERAEVAEEITKTGERARRRFAPGTGPLPGAPIEIEIDGKVIGKATGFRAIDPDELEAEDIVSREDRRISWDPMPDLLAPGDKEGK